MSQHDPLVRGDFSALSTGGAEAIREAVSRVLAGGDDAGALVAALAARTVALLRRGSREALRADALALTEALDSEAGRAFERNAPVAYGRLDGLAALLTEAVFARGPHAVDAVLASHPKWGAAVLDALRGRGGEMARKELRDLLGIPEAQLSRLLGDFEEVDLVRRERDGKEVVVVLGSEGWGRER